MSKRIVPVIDRCLPGNLEERMVLPKQSLDFLLMFHAVPAIVPFTDKVFLEILHVVITKEQVNIVPIPGETYYLPEPINGLFIGDVLLWIRINVVTEENHINGMTIYVCHQRCHIFHPENASVNVWNDKNSFHLFYL